MYCKEFWSIQLHLRYSSSIEECITLGDYYIRLRLQYRIQLIPKYFSSPSEFQFQLRCP